MLDVRDRSKRDDPDWLARQLAKSAGKSADEIAERLATAAVERHGGEPRDDIAILVLHRRGAS
jgi:serine phosphatase RsbU (regulator of sigma subunit)